MTWTCKNLWLALAALLLLLTACAHTDMDDEPETRVTADGKGVLVQLGVNIHTEESETRMSSVVTQKNNTFRGMDHLWIIPFMRNGGVNTNDQRLSSSIPLSSIAAITNESNVQGYENDSNYGLVANNHSHMWGRIGIPRHTQSVLVYGRATASTRFGSDESSVGYRHENGILAVNGIEGESDIEGEPASAITFAPVPIYQEQLTEGQRLADILTDVLNTTYEYTLYYRRYSSWYTVTGQKLVWRSTGLDTSLQNYYTEMTNGGAQIAGSGKAVTALLTSLYRELKAYSSSNTTVVTYSSYTCYISQNNSTSNRMTYGYLYEQLRDEIVAKIEKYCNVSGSGNNAVLTLKGSYADLGGYPDVYGLPEGCVAMEWRGETVGFKVKDASDGVLITPTDTYCYPPSLYYYVNSDILTSEADDESDHYVSGNTWQQILTQYTADGIVRPETQSVAVVDPLHYGVGLLHATIQVTSGSNTLVDNSTPPKQLSVSGNNFPVTGIIIGNQRRQAYNFTPMNEQAYFLYDNSIEQTYLSTSSSLGKELTTLALQTPEEEDVTIALELQNNSGITFTGQDGNIVPGSKFYLLGVLEYSSANQHDPDKNSVFIQSHITEVTLKVHDLKKAVNNIPDLRDPQLLLGVSLVVDWHQSTSTSVPVY